MQLGWIDYSDSDRETVQRVLSLLREPGAVDELGIGTVRDAFSNLFFPGTSTQNTKARYFLIVPYTFFELEKRGICDKKTFVQELNKLEKLTCESICRNSDNYSGIMGSTTLGKSTWLENPPSAVYWTGIRRYGLYCPSGASSNMSRNQHISWVCSRNKETTKQVLETDESDSSATVSFWNIPEHTDSVAHFDSIALTKSEAEFLSSRIRSSCPESLLAAMLQDETLRKICLLHKNTNEWHSFESPLSVIVQNTLESFRPALEQAMAFSDLIHCAYVRFNLLLSQDDDSYKEEWRDCVPIASIAAQVVNIASIEAICSTVFSSQVKVFIKELQGAFLDLPLAENSSDKLDSLLINRERRIKGDARSKLLNPGKYDSNTPVGSFYLDYRFNKAATLVGEIEEALNLNA